MTTAMFYGAHKKCPNRTCNHEFYKESHLGWLPHDEGECVAVMRCPKCRDTFQIIQPIAIVSEYYVGLPNDPARVNKFKQAAITIEEIDRVKRRMEHDPQVLSKVFGGKVPGANTHSSK